MEDLLWLLGIPAPSGSEATRVRALKARLGNKCRRAWEDTIGNLYLEIGSDQTSAAHLLVTAHLDEVGLQLRHADDRGFLFFRRIGGLRLDALTGRRVEILTGDEPVHGVIAVRDPTEPMAHSKDETRQLPSDESSYWIDIGCRSREEALQRVRIGDAAVLADSPARLGHKCIAARGLDNGVGCWVLVRVIEQLAQAAPPCRVTVCFSAQEEIGLRGARVASQSLDLAAALVVDVVEATDQPDSEPRRHGLVALGAGPVVNRGPNFDPRLSETLLKLAGRHGLLVQTGACPEVSSTDASPLQVAGRGLPTALIDVPLRYMHTGSEVVEMADARGAVALISAFAFQFTG